MGMDSPRTVFRRTKPQGGGKVGFGGGACDPPGTRERPATVIFRLRLRLLSVIRAGPGRGDGANRDDVKFT